MSESAVRREKLVNPLSLVLIGVVFAIAFALLLPGAQTFLPGRSAGQEAAGKSPQVVDDLEFAYLKARSASGDLEESELSVAVDSLIENRQTVKLEELLTENPSLQLSARQQYRMELESGVSAFQKAGGEPGDNAETVQLSNTLSLVLTEPELRTPSNLFRALELSKLLQTHDMTREFYSFVVASNDAAINDDVRIEYLQECGNYFASVAEHRDSVDCFNQALQLPVSLEAEFDINLAMLTQLSLLGNPVDVEEVVTRIVVHQPKSIQQLEKAARTLLSVGRPDASHPLYAELAQSDTGKTALWYSEAAKWAQASADPYAAAQYMEKMIAAAPGSKTADIEAQLQEYWIAAGENERALEQIYVQLESRNGDVDVLRKGVMLARQLNLLGQAKLWNEQLLQTQRDDLDAIKLQADLALGVRNIDEAFEWANVAVVMEPDNIESRRKLAQISEWSGRPAEAEEHWHYIARKAPDSESVAQVVRLAEMNFRPESAAQASLQLALMQKPDNDSIDNLIEFYEDNGEPLAAAAAIRKIIETHGRSAFLLTRLGQLHMHHAQYTEAMTIWEEFEKHYGGTVESTLALTELHWRLDKPEQAVKIATKLRSAQELEEASDYQIRLLSELSWRYKEPELGRMLEPVLDKLEDGGQQEFYQRRILTEYEQSGNYNKAFELANQKWRASGKVADGLYAMELAGKTDNRANFDAFLASTRDTASLRLQPRYWSMAASHYLQQGDQEKTSYAYRKALEVEPGNSAAISGLLWQFIGDGNLPLLETALAKFSRRAQTESELWAPYAVGYLQLGQAEKSLSWFEKQIDSIEADYSLLLTFSDALEAAGNVEHAYKVRRFAVGKLRPLIASATSKDQLQLARQYTTMVTRYGGAEQAEEWTRYLVNTKATTDETEKFWRQDVALAWLMATQRHEHARLIMARIHEERVRQPSWQKLSMALNDNDRDTLDAVLASADNISIGNRILALGVLGRDHEAMQLARTTIRSGSSLSDRDVAAQQYVYLRGVRPSYSSAQTRSTSSGELASNDTGIELRHTFASSPYGVGVALNHSDMSSDTYNLDQRDSRDTLELSMYFGNSRQGGRLTTGFVASDDTDVSYATGRYFSRSADGSRQIAAEFGYNEPATQSSALRVAALQNRAAVEFETSFGVREYLRLSADATDLFTRVEEAKIARGLQARAEVGMRGTFGSNNWSGGLSVSGSKFNQESRTPAELRLTPSTTIATVIAEESASLALGGSLSRGGIGTDYPQTSSPRYFLNGILGHAWPEQAFGVQLEGGIGMRVLGGDELSFSFAHDGLASTLTSGEGNNTSFGLNYQYHFKR